MDYRIEHDTMGEIRVAADRLFGAQTQRSLQNFEIGTEKMPLPIIHAFAYVKKAAALSNKRLGILDERRADLIAEVCDEIITGMHDDHFPLVVWQTGSGTQSNMNVNEVIANRANQIAGETLVHPNDHVNRSQSSNDTFPTAMHVAAKLSVIKELIPSLDILTSTFEDLSNRYMDVIKIGRTHLQDATPITLGQEISGWHAMLVKCRKMILTSLEDVSELALGGTAVGTGLNAHPRFGEDSANEITRLTGETFVTAPNKFHSLTSKDAIVFAHGALKALAADLMKIANDVRLLSSGPRCGIGELIIPENEPGSSIMPGKVNPTQCEAVTMVAVQVMGNDVSVSMAASQGNFELNVFMPVCIYNFLQSVKLLADAMRSFNDNCAIGIQPNHEAIERNLANSLVLVTALNPAIGYENAAKTTKYAFKNGVSLREAVIALDLMTGEDFDATVRPENMVSPLKVD